MILFPLRYQLVASSEMRQLDRKPSLTQVFCISSVEHTAARLKQ